MSKFTETLLDIMLIAAFWVVSLIPWGGVFGVISGMLQDSGVIPGAYYPHIMGIGWYMAGIGVAFLTICIAIALMIAPFVIIARAKIGSRAK